MLAVGAKRDWSGKETLWKRCSSSGVTVVFLVGSHCVDTFGSHTIINRGIVGTHIFLRGTTSDREASIGTCHGVFSLEGGVFAKVANIKATQGGFSEISPFQVGPIKASTSQDGILENGTSQGATLETSTIYNRIRKISPVELGCCDGMDRNAE